jgi:uncharacterized membrane protein
VTWLQRYRVRHYVSNSIWIWPVVSMVTALLAAYAMHVIGMAMGLESTLNPDTAQTVLATMAASMFTFIVFVSSALLVAVQLASTQLTPRIIAIVFRDPVTKTAFVIFVFTFTFALAALVRITTSVPPLTTRVAAYSSLASVGFFLFLIDHVGKALRPSGALWAVASYGREVIENVYPRRLDEQPGAQMIVTPAPDDGPSSTVLSRTDGVILAFDVAGLVSLAQRADCVIELLPQVGDFVAMGDPLLRLYQCGLNLPSELLQQSVAVGQERTLEQDPTFAFRIIVDIACKGLSPAINDPTTAVLALDQIHHLLRDVGLRRLDDERVRDKSGALRLLYRTPDWEDFVKLAVTEIRHFGGASIQVARRLRAMLENLIQTLPEERVILLRQELELLHRSSQHFFREPEDRALAEVSDYKGVGGRHGKEPKSRILGKSDAGLPSG